MTDLRAARALLVAQDGDGSATSLVRPQRPLVEALRLALAAVDERDAVIAKLRAELDRPPHPAELAEKAAAYVAKTTALCDKIDAFTAELRRSR